MLKSISSMAVLVSSLLLVATELPREVKLDKKGSFQIGSTQFAIQAFSASWRSVTNTGWKDVKGQANSTGLNLNATLSIDGNQASVSEAIEPTGENTFQLKFKAKFASPATINALHCAINLPTDNQQILIDGKPFKLPAEYSKTIIYNNNKVNTLAFTATDGTPVEITGSPLKLFIQDDRRFGYDMFSLRLSATPNSGSISDASLTLDFKLEPLKIQKVNLTAATNAGFADEVANDGKGGWTDQGPENDLRMIKPGTIEIGALAFDILDTTKNQGKGAVVVSGKNRDFLASSATVTLPKNNAQVVNLLHASAWTPKLGVPLGTLVAQYSDGTSEQIPVKARIDCGNWWEPTPDKNAGIAWKAENQESTVGLYASSFALSKPGPSALQFVAIAPDTVWMIAGVTLSNRVVKFANLALTDNKPLEMKENNQWKRLDYKRTIRKGGPLDFSANVDGPAGKYGRIIATPQGTLAFENAPDKRIRLYGANLVFTASFLNQEGAQQIADFFAYCGYNTVRFHHNDKVMSDSKAEKSSTINPEKLDKLEYLFYQMKEKGLYITTDLFASRVFKATDAIPECGSDYATAQIMKQVIPISPAAMESWKEFARNFMTHKNPYTGMTWAEDPAFFSVNLVNEEVLTSCWSRTPSVVKLYEKAFQNYCQEKHLPTSATSNSNPVFRRFLHELQSKVLDEQIRFVKEDLKVKALVTSLNYVNDIPLTLLRSKFDLVDDHQYLDHPSFPEKKWSLPNQYRQVSAIKGMASLPRSMMGSRILGKPFMVTEFNFCNPNIYRAEAGPLIGSYAALQDWDALYRFAWSHSDKGIYEVGTAFGFNASADPMAQFSDRIAIAMFLHGEVASAPEAYAYSVPQDCIEQRLINAFPSSFTKLGLITRIGSVPQGDKSVPAGVTMIAPADSDNPAKLKDPKIASLWKQANADKLAVSSTGQLRLDAKTGTFAVNAPRVESVTLSSGNLTAGALSVQNASCYQTVAAISLDSKPIAESDSVLLFQLTNIVNTGELFETSSMLLVRKVGQLPLLVQKGSATVGIASKRPYKVEALNCDGEPYGIVQGTYENGIYRFKADTTLFPGGVMAYHLTR